MAEKKQEKNDEKKPKKSKKVVFVVLLLLLLLLSGVAFGVIKFYSFNIGDFLKNRAGKNEEKTEEIVAVEKNRNNETENSENLLVDDGENVEKKDEENNLIGGASISENYQITQIRFGGNNFTTSVNEENGPLEINEIKGEIVKIKNDESPKILVSWKTNKLAKSEIIYSKKDDEKSKTAKEEDYNIEHNVLLTDIETGNIYIYKINVRDKWGNTAQSEYFSVHSGNGNTSVIDLIIDSVKDIFGWAM